MNRIIEEEFVRSFIDERYRDSLLLELCSERMRRRAEARFADDAAALLDRRLIAESGEGMSAGEIFEAANRVASARECYLMFSDWSDGETVPTEEGIAACLDSCGPSVVLFGDAAALVKEKGNRETCKKYFLCRKHLVESEKEV